MCKVFLILLLSVATTSALYLTQRYPCGNLRIQNGKTKFRQKGKLVRFTCNPGYILAGSKYSSCIKNKWDTPVPMCVRPTCSAVKAPLNGLIFPTHNGAVINFYCKSGYTLRGSNITYCDGRKWSSNLPTCAETGKEPEKSCDFETEDLCGWSHDLNHDFDWRRQNLNTPTGFGIMKTGPSFDHTKGQGENGYYLYIESSGKLENNTAVLISPVYSAISNKFCFEFWYHMFGTGIGDLKVYLKKEKDSSDTRKLKPYFQKSGNQGDEWFGKTIYFEPIDQPFQIIIEGIRGSSYVSDIAIDDVAISEDCEAGTTMATETDLYEYTETPVVYDSCLNRCDSEKDSNFTCDCFESCIENDTCCPDYNVLCVLDDFTDSTSSEPDWTTEIAFSTEKITMSDTYLSTLVEKPTQKIIPSPKTTTTPKPTTSTSPTTQKPTTTTQKSTTTPKKTPQIIIPIKNNTQNTNTTKIPPPKFTLAPQKLTMAPKNATQRPYLVPKGPIGTKNETKMGQNVPKTDQKVAKPPPKLPLAPKRPNNGIKIGENPKNETVVVKIDTGVPKTDPKMGVKDPKLGKNEVVGGKNDPKVSKNDPTGSKNDVNGSVGPRNDPRVTINDPNRFKNDPKRVGTDPKVPKTGQKETKVDDKKVLPPKSGQNDVFKPNSKGFETTLTPKDLTQGTLEVETDFFVTMTPQNDRIMLLKVEPKEFDLKLIIGVISTLVFVMLVTLVVVLTLRKYNFRIFGRFNGYRGSHRSDSFSDVRFLASDEVLDFSLRSAD